LRAHDSRSGPRFLPGWLVELLTKSEPEVWVLNPKMLKAFIEREPVALSAEDVAVGGGAERQGDAKGVIVHPWLVIGSWRIRLSDPCRGVCFKVLRGSINRRFPQDRRSDHAGFPHEVHPFGHHLETPLLLTLPVLPHV